MAAVIVCGVWSGAALGRSGFVHVNGYNNHFSFSLGDVVGAAERIQINSIVNTVQTELHKGCAFSSFKAVAQPYGDSHDCICVANTVVGIVKVAEQADLSRLLGKNRGSIRLSLKEAIYIRAVVSDHKRAKRTPMPEVPMRSGTNAVRGKVGMIRNRSTHMQADLPVLNNSSDLEREAKPRALGIGGEFILPLHGIGGQAGIFNSLARQNDLLVEEDSSDRRYQDRREGSGNHPKGPKRRGLLGSEVALFMVLGTGGAGVCYGAFNRAGKTRNIWHTLGWSGVVALSVLLASYSLIVLAVGAV